jgi:hypothetical protein
MTNTNLVIFKPIGKQFILKLLNFGNLDVQHQGKRIGI